MLDSDCSTVQMTAEEKIIWSVIDHHHGKAAAIKGRVIAEITGIHYDKVRAIISHLASRHNKFIGSCGDGYFVPVTPGEHYMANKSLKHRALTILHRCAAQERLSLDEVFNQAKMDFEKKAS